MKFLCKLTYSLRFSIRFIASKPMYKNSANNVREFTIFAPPKEVQGMKILDRNLFE